DFFFQAEDGIRFFHVTGVQTCALPISMNGARLIARLRAELGDSSVLVDPDVTASYSHDMMPLADRAKPLAVVLPADVEGVQATEIGRASCRESGKTGGAGVLLETAHSE